MVTIEETIAERLQEWEAEYRDGNTTGCLDAIWLCLQFNRPVPEWARLHFSSSMGRYTFADAKTLDEAFGIRRPKGWHQNRARQRYRRGLAVHVKARALVERAGYTVEDAVAEVADQFSMSEADVERWYYDKLLMMNLGYPQKTEKN